MIIDGINIPRSNRQVGKLFLYEYQIQFIEARKHWLFLQTPTGSGKTLALLAKVLLDIPTTADRPRPFETASPATIESLTNQRRSLVGRTNRNGIFLYPTNELIKDQVSSLVSLCEELGFHPRILDVTQFLENDRDDGWRRNLLLDLMISLREHPNCVLLLAINGPKLDELVAIESEAKGQLIYGILSEISNSEIPCFICTNMDTLYLIIQGKYKRSSQILNTLINWRYIAIDEFHLYSGVELANLLYTLMLYHTLIHTDLQGNYWFAFSSATPSRVSNLFLSSFPDDSIVITAKQVPEPMAQPQDVQRIRHETEFHAYPSTSIFYKAEDVERLANFICEVAVERNIHTLRDCNVSILVLVNSITFCEALFHQVKKRLSREQNLTGVPIYRIHGFVPSQERPSIRDLEGALLVGTSSIELGIDFDVPILVFEAYDEGSFLQRLGRGGRHHPCLTHAFLPQTAVTQFNQLDINKTWLRIPFNEVVQAARNGLREEVVFENFLFSEVGIKLLAILIHSLEPNRPNRNWDQEAFETRQGMYERLRERYVSNTELRFPKPPAFNRSLSPQIVRVLRRYAFARGSSIHFPALINLEDLAPHWRLMSLHDLVKCNFSLRPFQGIHPDRRACIPRRWRLRLGDLIPHVTNISRNRHFVPELLHAQNNRNIHNNFGRVFYANNGGHELLFKSNLGGDFDNNINQLIRQRILPFVHIPKDVDWRVPSIKEQNSNARIVIGEAAFLASYIYNVTNQNRN